MDLGKLRNETFFTFAVCIVANGNRKPQARKCKLFNILQALKPKESQKYFIAALTEHRVLGYLFAAYLVVENDKKTFYTIHTQVTLKHMDELGFDFTPDQRKLVELIDNYSEEKLSRKFSRNENPKNFFQNIDQDRFNKFVYPYFDKQLIKCINLIAQSDIKLYIKQDKYSNLYEEDRIEIQPLETVPIFHFELQPTGLQYWLTLKYAEQTVKIFKRKLFVITDSPCRFVLHNKLYWFDNITAKRLLPFTEKEIIRVPPTVTEKYFQTFVSTIIREHKVVAKGFEIKDVEHEKKAIISIEEDLQLNPVLVLKFQYGNKRFLSAIKGHAQVELVEKNGTYSFLRHSRDFDWEKNTTEQLQSLGAQLNSSYLEIETLHGLPTDDTNERYCAIEWMTEHHSKLSDWGIIVENHIVGKKYFLGSQNLEIKVANESDWFDLYAVVHFGDYQIPFLKLRKNILNGIREYVLPSGEIAILPQEWFEKFAELMPFADEKDNFMRFSNHHYNLLNQKLGETLPTTKNPFNKLETSQFELLEQPKALQATLRSYQREGYSWLHFLSKNRFGGCLADDMGLGKTIQTLSLLLKSKLEEEPSSPQIALPTGGQLDLFSQPAEQKPASLIVVPTSLVHNWANEIKKFTPQLKLYKHIGHTRRKGGELTRAFYNFDIVITTYGTIRNDYLLFKPTTFKYLILDESQSIKNSESKTYQSVIELKAQNRIAITGTPIENSLSDLWSQMHFLNRGLLGSQPFFKKEFIIPIEKLNDEQKQVRLQNLIRPFILRRTKEEVASDLPALTEQISYCEMSEEQESVYEREKSAIRNKLLDNLKSSGGLRTQIMVLQGLTRLRQLANHPAMLSGYEQLESGKFEEVMLNLENLMAENHKVLMFSSYVKHLSLFENEFSKRNWDFCLLTGQTQNRAQVIDAFQNDPKKRIFLISLKAGGVGLNLTSADYIFILDPWWNPAAENQAISRAHRIGQDKKVFVYRFITENTIEEKIQNLKERKTNLANLFVKSNNPFDQISPEEIIDLFS